MEEKQYRAVLKDLAQIIIGELVEETETELILKRPSMLGVSVNQEQGMNIQFIPMDVVSINPAVSLRVLLSPDAEERNFRLKKDNLLLDKIELNEQIFNGYRESLEPKNILTPNPSELVGPNGEPIREPKVQPLF